VKLGVSILAVALVAGSLSACGPSTGVTGTVPPPSAAASVDASPRLTPEPSDSPSSPSGSPPASRKPARSPANPRQLGHGTQLVRTYFVLGGPSGSTGLVATLRKVPTSNTPPRPRSTRSSRARRPRRVGTRSPRPSPTAASSWLTIKNRLATIDLSSEFESDGGSASIHDRLGQVVYTLTQFATIHSVAFRSRGKRRVTSAARVSPSTGPSGVPITSTSCRRSSSTGPHPEPPSAIRPGSPAPPMCSRRRSG